MRIKWKQAEFMVVIIFVEDDQESIETVDWDKRLQLCNISLPLLIKSKAK